MYKCGRYEPFTGFLNATSKISPEPVLRTVPH